MRSENSTPKRRSLTDLAQQFLMGIAFGLLLALIPLFYISVSTLELKLLYVEVLIALVFSCGILAVIFGAKFLSPLIIFLKSIPPWG